MANDSAGCACTDRKLAPSVDVVIVNWNSGKFLRDCLAALDKSTNAEELNVIVVDNGSTDDSTRELAVKRTRFDLLKNLDNRGFASASNQGARKGEASHLLFLNPDVRVAADAVEKAIKNFDDPAYSDVGIQGIQLFDGEGRIQRTCARAPSFASLLLHTLFLDRLCPRFVRPHFLTEWDHEDTRAVDQVIGAFLMIRRSLFEELGGFDERFFLYYEDVDLCLAARRAGWRVVHFAGAQAEHAGGGSTNAIKARRLLYVAISKAEYTAKWHGPLAAGVLIMFTLCVEMPLRWLHATFTRSPQEGLFVLQAMALFCQDLRKLTWRIGARS